MTEAQQRLIFAGSGLLIAIILITVLSLIYGEDSRVGAILLDRDSRAFPYPFTIQNIMWVMLALGIAELLVRFLTGQREAAELRRGLLPEDDETMLRSQDLAPIYERLLKSRGIERSFLERLVSRVILQFQSSRSVDQSNALLNSSLELFQHEMSLRYSMIRYLVWLIPTLGFIGTVIGISLALNAAGEPPDLSDQEAVTAWMGALTGSLSVAFYTTLVALVFSAILVFGMHLVQSQEEAALNRTGQYCLDNLINRLYEG